MIEPEFLRRCGVVIERDFLDPPLCQRVARIISRRHQAVPAPAYKTGTSSVVETARRTRLVSLPPAMVASFRQQLDAWQPRLAEHFQVELVEHEVPQFLHYSQGDYFRAHVDRAYDDPASPAISRRRVSVVVFFNAPGNDNDSGDYTGGDLVLYGVLPGEKWKTFGAAVPVRSGTLIAFSSNLAHEVTEVTSGMRATAVSWYLAPET